MKLYTVLDIVLIVSMFAYAAYADKPYKAQGTPHFCPVCQQQKLKSKVWRGSCINTLLDCGQGFWDENGLFNPPKMCNTRTCSYSCSQSHSWSEAEDSY